MDVKEAAQKAKDYINDVYASEDISNVGLEEVEHNAVSGIWKITVGFSRPWDTKNVLTAALSERRPERSYKVVHVDCNGEIETLTDRFLPSPSA